MKQVKTAKGRKISSTLWLKRHINDPFVKQSQKEKYESRAAYKLIEIEDKFNVLKNKKNIVDLGAAPGSWTQVVKQKCPKARVIALDLLPIKVIEDVHFIQGDFTDPEISKHILTYLGNEEKIDTILSDIAPNTTGHTQTDHLRIMNICFSVVEFAIQHLNLEGNLVIKFFQGSEDKELIFKIKQNFSKVKIFKPKSSRAESVEKYIVATGFKKMVL